MNQPIDQLRHEMTNLYLARIALSLEAQFALQLLDAHAQAHRPDVNWIREKLEEIEKGNRERLEQVIAHSDKILAQINEIASRPPVL